MHIISADKNYQIRLQIFFYVILHRITPSGVIFFYKKQNTMIDRMDSYYKCVKC